MREGSRVTCSATKDVRCAAITGAERAVRVSRPARLLTPREYEVMFWVIQGKSNWEVAQILGCVEQTVNKHLQRIYRKLGVELRFPIAVPGFPSAIRLFVLTHSRRKVRSRQRPHGRGQCFTRVRQRSEDSGQRTDIWKTVG